MAEEKAGRDSYSLSNENDDLELHELADVADTEALLEKTTDEEAQPPQQKDGPVTWLSLPRKDQLAILFLCRFVDFLQVASLQAYVFYQLRSLDGTKSDSEISAQVGILQGSSTGAQVLTAILWGKAADATWCGRKTVLVVGLLGTAVSCLGCGFASSFYWAVFWRALGGAINGLVGIIRTMIAEITVQRKYQSRAFLILPMSFNVAGILGPLLGGYLADPSRNLPSLFGKGCLFGSRMVEKYPYALPGIINAILLSVTAAIVFLGLEETLKSKKNFFDWGLYITARAKQIILRRPIDQGFTRLRTTDAYEEQPFVPKEIADLKAQTPEKPAKVLPFNRIWTRNVILTLVTGAFYDFHLGAFTNLWTLFLSTPRVASTLQSLPISFSGGLGMPSSMVGSATSILGVLGMLLQICLYPPVHARLGTLRSFQWFLILFPIAYFFAPYLAPAPERAGHHPRLGAEHLGRVRTVGLLVSGWWYGAGLDMGVVGASWWGVTGMSTLGCVAAMFIYEGSGHEIILD
ncbi:hypothetical protein G7054_g6557 [Neopestalotiopsis clavispora]|nr:hypothetical protein G7054_g6557 [Neopestalotiopsis clavispora]